MINVLFSLPLAEVDFDRSVLYSTIILAVLLTGKNRSEKFLFKLWEMTRWQTWSKMALNRHKIMFDGLRWGVPLRQIKKLLSIHKIVRRKRSSIHKKRGHKNVNRTIEMYRIMPLKAMSRAWGKFNQLELPVILRRPLLGLYVWMFDCKLDEAMETELRNYRNLGEFFRRILKPDMRLISIKEELTNPADGKILHFGEVTDGILEQVKGVNYSVKHFLGPQTWMNDSNAPTPPANMTDEEYFRGLKLRPGNKLYHCVVYLAPGDYHRFHSAAKWDITYRRHFPGELLSVNPGIARWIHGLFVLNERVAYMGEWEHGFFSYTAVGATNVGSIKIYCDQEMMTNVKHHPDTRLTPGVYFDKDFRQNPIHVEKGEMFGEFNLGSTIVLVFEAPENFVFNVINDQKVRMGEPMGTCIP
ncbi:phosphatidylserine decarboxylase proenzyme, mitochondrial-like isoform X1 [Saccostrea echinata]|uniref:phosphatidylserine decarboxylase proenzyme, mitochondrial-like isoform X1 n=1 Tax=Saccostrea echinata TaxID=191078 RepID=UPI002A800B58|nr:phosphatidylserine decarboxylase proenzyme, mitochondrial-like isoform X1 [Saccostrea echinata]